MLERIDPKILKAGLILAAVVYFLFPYDLLPDFLGIPGRIDDLLLMAWLAWFYRNHVLQHVQPGPEQASTGSSDRAGRDQGSRSTGATHATPFDPYAILGVTRSSSGDAIRAAYRSRMQEYHPDKVAHLGPELQELAHEKSQQIQRAYQQLSR